MSKPKPLHQILKEIHEETSKFNGIIKQPEKKLNGWENDFNAWEKQFTKRMGELDKFISKQMGNIEKFFE
ncbi:hypothetical protein MUN89_15995 [Halobacillus salinarum]|uniref:Uncharacterized protein n=1 Tax=Halobacillus salinarum TaxID=2932257 RepID=A0ABY4EG15_9BACI|nr:hypothetical protein [Halobacillus salinarum]UOQ43410.1 hypothetical protein MUN89_15995 [Halobacillus salinarum]